MFRFISAALACAVAWSLVQARAAEPDVGAQSRPVTLKEAVARALDAAPALKARQELLTAAEAQLRQSTAFPNPTIDVELENAAGSGRFSNLDESELTVGVRQRIERGGKRDGRRSVAEAERDAAAIAHERMRLDVVLEARKAFIEVFAAKAALAVAETRFAAAREIETMAKRRVAAGRDPVTASLRAEIQAAEARTAREQAEHDLHNAKRTLAVLWGDPEAHFDVDGAALDPTPPERGKGVDEGASLDVAAREAAARRAAATVELEEANAGGDFTLGAGVRRFENGGDLAGVFSVSVPLAIFDTNQGNIDRAAAESRAAQLDVADARRRHAISLVAYEEDAARARAELETVRRDLLPRATSALAAARRGYAAGAFSYQEVAEAQRILNELQDREVAALRAVHIAHANLDRLTGRSPFAQSDQGTTP